MLWNVKSGPWQRGACEPVTRSGGVEDERTKECQIKFPVRLHTCRASLT